MGRGSRYPTPLGARGPGSGKSKTFDYVSAIERLLPVRRTAVARTCCARDHPCCPNGDVAILRRSEIQTGAPALRKPIIACDQAEKAIRSPRYRVIPT
jgi:hypothetical protein